LQLAIFFGLGDKAVALAMRCLMATPGRASNGNLATLAVEQSGEGGLGGGRRRLLSATERTLAAREARRELLFHPHWSKLEECRQVNVRSQVHRARADAYAIRELLLLSLEKLKSSPEGKFPGSVTKFARKSELITRRLEEVFISDGSG
jgi:hypothetical protein